MKTSTTTALRWRTLPVPVAAGLPWWKRPAGESCPHGLVIYYVCGTRVRNTLDSDFDQGGNGYAYPFIPKNEIWVDDHVPAAERPLVTFHECRESELMKRGMSYNDAHEKTKREEDAVRRVLRPGEPDMKQEPLVVLEAGLRNNSKIVPWTQVVRTRYKSGEDVVRHVLRPITREIVRHPRDGGVGPIVGIGLLGPHDVGRTLVVDAQVKLHDPSKPWRSWGIVAWVTD